jgi:hypothetical protein
MHRRRVLAALPFAVTAGLAGCTGRPDEPTPPDTTAPDRAPRTAISPAPPDFPDPPAADATVTRASARRFVERHAEARIRADLLERSGPPIVAISVEDARSAVIRGVDVDSGGAGGPAAGYLLTSACAGQVRYRETRRGGGGGYGVNAHGVVHYVAPGAHARVSGSVAACREPTRTPYRAADPTRNVATAATDAGEDGGGDGSGDADDGESAGRTPAGLRLLDFGPDDDRARLRVSLTDETGGGGLAFRTDARFFLPEADHRFRTLVYPRVTAASGVYRLRVDVTGGGETDVEWSLPPDGGPDWWSTCVGVRPDGDPVVFTVRADGDLGLGRVGCAPPGDRRVAPLEADRRPAAGGPTRPVRADGIFYAAAGGTDDARQ